MRGVCDTASISSDLRRRALWPVLIGAVALAIIDAAPARATAPRLDLTIAADAAVSLELANYTKSEDTQVCGGDWPPQKIGADSSRESCFQQYKLTHVDAETEFTYKINDGKFVVWGYSKVPLVGENIVRCQIRKSGSSNEELYSPFTCASRFTDSGNIYNPKPRFQVARKPTKEITDRNQSIQLLNDNCGQGQPQCSFISASQRILAAPQSKWQMWGAAQANCISKPTEPHTISDAHTISWSDTIGVKATGKFKILAVEATIEGSYQHTITDSYTYQESHTQNIPYGKVGAFYLQPGYLEITGDFLISTRDENLSIKNVTFELPLSNDFKPEHGGPTIRKVVLWSMEIGDAGCNNGQPTVKLTSKAGSPPPPGAVKIESGGE